MRPYPPCILRDPRVTDGRSSAAHQAAGRPTRPCPSAESRWLPSRCSKYANESPLSDITWLHVTSLAANRFRGLIRFSFMILTVGGEKGGVGKSTLAIHLAYMLARHGRDPLLIDADPQASSTNFTAARDERGAEPRLACVQKLGKGLAHDVRSLAGRYSDIVVDTGGRDTVELRLAMLVSERVLVPINCSAFNWWTLEKVDQLAGEAKLANPDLRTSVLLNRAPGNPQLRRRKVATTNERLAAASFSNLDVLSGFLVERTAFQDNEEFGLTVWEPSVVRGTVDVLACDELANLYQEIFAHEFAIGPSTVTPAPSP